MNPPLKTNVNSSSSSDSPLIKLLTTDGTVLRLKNDRDRRQDTSDAVFVVADGEKKAVCGDGKSLSAKWVVETVPGKANTIRLKSSTSNGGYCRYLTATGDNRVHSTEIAPAGTAGSMLTWEPGESKHGVRLEMSEKKGFFLKANGAGEQLSVGEYPPEDTTTKAIRWFPVKVSSPSQKPGK